MSTLNILMDPAQKQREDEARAKVQADQTKVDNLEKELENKVQIPDKFKGKSMEDVVSSYVNLEKELGRTKNELSQVRSTVDQLVPLEREITKPKEQARKPLETDDLLHNPDETITRAIEENPSVQDTKARTEALERSLLMGDFTNRHPTYQQDLANPDFVEWIKASALRMRLAAAADRYDFQSAEELWSLWGEYSSFKKDHTDTRKLEQEEERKRKEIAGTLESGTGNSTENKKILSRNEIIDLKKRAKQGDRKAASIVEDPNWQAEVNRAYLEKRVI